MLLCYEILDQLKLRKGKLRKYWIDHKNKKRSEIFYIKICQNCGYEFIGRKNSKFCNNSCHWYYIHKNMSKEKKENFKKKISKTKKERKSPAWNKRSFNYANYDTHESKIGWIDKVRRNKKENRALETICSYCGKWFVPTLEAMYARVNPLSKGIDRSKFYCSQHCKDACPIFNKHSNIVNKEEGTSKEVNAYLRQIILKRDKYTCQKCGKSHKIELHCHHIIPKNISYIEKEDPNNCITVCKKCHIKIHKSVGCKYNEIKCKNN